MQKEYKIKKISWEGENDLINILLMCKKDRDTLGIVENDVVKIFVENEGVEVSTFAIVMKQFKQDIEEGAITVNTKLSVEFNFTVGGSIKVESNITESEYEAYRKIANDAFRRRLLGGEL